MEENFANNVVDQCVSNTDVVNSDDSMMLALMKLIFVVLIGGLFVKIFNKISKWFKENKRLRELENQRKADAAIEARAEKLAQQKIDELLAKQVESEKAPEKKD